MSNSICNICGCDHFVPGFNNRLSINRIPPKCDNCGSLERDRILFDSYKLLKEILRGTERLLSFAKMPLKWESQFFQITNIQSSSIDIESLPIDDDSYDWIICNHILQATLNDKLAMKELLRVLNDNGVLQITVPLPLKLSETYDWGFPEPKKNMHYRTYGRNFFNAFYDTLINHKVFSCTGVDSVTNDKDIVFFITKNSNVINYFQENQNFIEETLSKSPNISIQSPCVHSDKISDNFVDTYTLSTAKNMVEWYHEHADFVAFREKMQGYPESDYMNSNLKLIQDLCICNFIRKYVSTGARIF